MYNRVICARDSVLLSTVQYVMHFRFNDKNLLVCLARFAARVPSIYRAYHAERSITLYIPSYSCIQARDAA